MNQNVLNCIGVILLWPLLGNASPMVDEQQCFSNHIREALELNSDRKEIYHQLTHGKSDAIYAELMAMEKLTLPFAKLVDKQAKIYHQHGIDLLCSEFMPMNEKELIILAPHPKGSKFAWKKYYKSLSVALSRDDFESVRSHSLAALVELKTEPNYHCLLRHFFESIYRFAYFAPKRIQEAQKIQIRSPKKMIKKLIRGHIMGLWFADRIDERSMPIQMRGIPMLCNELPPLLETIKLDELNALKEQ
jgi:hypothetical protein